MTLSYPILWHNGGIDLRLALRLDLMLSLAQFGSEWVVLFDWQDYALR